jgi:hypothetical protein
LAIEGTRQETPSHNARVSESTAMNFAVQHCFERASIVTRNELLRHALYYGVGDLNVEQTKGQLLRDEFIRGE